MKKKINVIDLDSTLLPHNSLIYYVLTFLKKSTMFLPVLFHLEQRITGKITKESFLKNYDYCKEDNELRKKSKKVRLSLYDDIRKPMLRFILKIRMNLRLIYSVQHPLKIMLNICVKN